MTDFASSVLSLGARRFRNALIALAALGVLILMLADRAAAVPPLGYETAVKAGATWDNGADHASFGGATWTYIGMRWDEIEATQGVQNWNANEIETRINAAKAAGLNLVLTVTGTPTWAGGTCEEHLCAPSDPTTFRNFIAAVQSRFSPAAIQVWNEPNTWHFGRESAFGMPVSTYYTKLFTPAYQALNGTGTQILAPGTAATLNTVPHSSEHEGGTYYQEWLQNFVNRAVGDGKTSWHIAQHMYAFKQASGLGGPVVQIAKIDNFARQLANENGLGPVWPTELGVSTGNPWNAQYSEGEQSTALSYIYCHTVGESAPMIVYRGVDSDNPALIEQEKPTAGLGTTIWQTAAGTWYNKPAYNALREDQKSAKECPPV